MPHDVDYASCAFRNQKYSENEKKNVKTTRMIQFRGETDSGGMRSPVMP